MVSSNCFTFPTMPTICRGFSSGEESNVISWPMGSLCGQNCRAIASLITATHADVSVSCSVMPRPRRIGMAHQTKIIRTDRIPKSVRLFGEDTARPVIVKPGHACWGFSASGSQSTNAALWTPGIYLTRSSTWRQKIPMADLLR